MRLCLDELDSALPLAPAAELPDGSRVITAPPLVIVLSALTLQPAPLEQPGALVTAALSRDCPPGCSVSVSPASAADPRQTALGWPLLLVHAQLVSADDTVVEERLGAVYQFLRYTATAIVRLQAAPGLHLEAQRPLLVQLLRSGRPDWRAGAAGTVAALWDIWQ